MGSAGEVPNLDFSSSAQGQDLVSHMENFGHEQCRLPRKVRPNDVFLAHRRERLKIFHRQRGSLDSKETRIH